MEAQRSIRSLVATAIERNKALLSNATSIVGTVGVSSGLGFVYWAVAAKLFSQSAVGLGSAATSAMTLLGLIGMFGLGPMLMGELPRRRVRGPLVSASLIAAGVGSLVLGIGFAAIAPRFGHGFGFITGGAGALVIFLFGVVITGVSKTFDQAVIGLLRGGLQLSRNLVFSIVKLVALPLAAFLIHDKLGVGIMLTWVVGIAFSFAWIAVRLSRSGVSVTPKPDWVSLRALGKVTMAHNWLNLAIFVPPALMPVIVTSIVSPAANAAFYVSWMIANFLYIVPASLSTVLFSIASADAAAMAGKLRFTLRVSMLLGIPGMLALFVGGPFILDVFGKSYSADGTLPLWLFTACYLPTVPVSFYIAVCRTTNKVSLAAAVLTTSSVIQVAAAAAGGVMGGLAGLSIALVAVKFIEGFVTLPAVVKATRYRASAGQARAPQADRWAGEARDVPSRRSVDDAQAAWRAADDLTRRQREGIAALIAVSMAGASTGPFPVIPDDIEGIVRARENARQVQYRRPPPAGRHRAGASRHPQQANSYPQQQLNGHPRAQSNGYAWPQSSGQPRPNGYPPPQSNGYPQSPSDGYAWPQSDGYAWPQSNGYPQSPSDGYAWPQSNGYPQQPDRYPQPRDQRRMPEYSNEDEYWSPSERRR